MAWILPQLEKIPNLIFWQLNYEDWLWIKMYRADDLKIEIFLIIPNVYLSVTHEDRVRGCGQHSHNNCGQTTHSAGHGDLWV